MRLMLVALLGLLPSAAIAPSTFAAAPPLTIAQAGLPQPDAQLDPNRPIEIRVVNAGDAPIVSVLTRPASSERSVAPGRTVTFGSTRTSFLPVPIDMLIYPEESELGLSVDVFAQNNVLTVVVGQQLATASPGNTAISVDGTGAVFLF